MNFLSARLLRLSSRFSMRVLVAFFLSVLAGDLSPMVCSSIGPGRGDGAACCGPSLPRGCAPTLRSAPMADLGIVAALHRFPVKSMLGESLDVAELTELGVTGDRAWAVLDRSDGRVATGKHPRKWSRL